MNPLRDHRNFSRAGGGGISPDDESAKAIVAQVLEQRSRGLAITDAQVLAAHPELHEQLKRELRLADQIRQAMLAAMRTSAAHEALPSFTDSEFDASIKTTENQAGENAPPSSEVMPSIPGYLLMDEINHGGQAVVFRAIQETTRRKVAIKVMSGGPFASSRHRVRFEREAKILAALDHPNIVTIIERGRTPDGSFFFVMPFIDGHPLDQLWSSQIARDADGLRELMRMFSKITAAVQEAHTRGIIHRDIKPSNVMVDQRLEPHVLDFGLARPVGEDAEISVQTITVPGQILGSLPWASPEQAAGQSRDLGAASDIYSIGVMLFQSLAGDFPYSLDGPIDQVLLRIRTQKVESPSKCAKARSHVDRSLDAIVLKCLAKSPGDRYLSAALLKSDLDAWLAGDPIEATHHRPRRHKTIAVATCAILLSTMVWLITWCMIRQSRPAVYQLPTLQNSIGMKFVLVPAGISSMGSPQNESGRITNEPERQVPIGKPFYISTTVVTEEQFDALAQDRQTPRKLRNSGMPMVNVSWLQAVDFCRRLGQKDHASYRLPTEAEWEYACRANNRKSFLNPAHPELSVFSIENSGGVVHAVGQKIPNAWGLFDMQGNVAQWCSDVYKRSENEDRIESSLPVRRVTRGGSAMLSLVQCRAASRNSAPESFQQADVGFRVVRDP